MPEDDALNPLIRERYPFPISHAYTYLESRVDPSDRYQALLSCFEVTLKTLSSIALANFMRDIQDDPALGNANLFLELLDTLSHPLSLGHWHHLLQITLRPYASFRERLVVPQLFDFYFRVTEHGNIRTQSENVRIIQRFIAERNEEAHHRSRGQATTFQRQQVLAELTRDLRSLLRTVSFLAKCPLVYLEQAEYHDGQWHYCANFASGNSYPFQQDTWRTHMSINSRRCLLLDQARSAVLELTPFMIVTAEGRLQQPDIFFFDGVFSSGRARFLTYHVSDYIEPTDEQSPASVASDSILSLLKLLRNRIPATSADEEIAEQPPFAVEIYRSAAIWALEHDERQLVSLDALRQILTRTSRNQQGSDLQ